MAPNLSLRSNLLRARLLLTLAATLAFAFAILELAPADAASPRVNGRIAFESRRAATTSEIFTMNADGSGVTRLTNNDSEDSSPTGRPTERASSLIARRTRESPARSMS